MHQDDFSARQDVNKKRAYISKKRRARVIIEIGRGESNDDERAAFLLDVRNFIAAVHNDELRAAGLLGGHEEQHWRELWLARWRWDAERIAWQAEQWRASRHPSTPPLPVCTVALLKRRTAVATAVVEDTVVTRFIHSDPVVALRSVVRLARAALRKPHRFVLPSEGLPDGRGEKGTRLPPQFDGRSPMRTRAHLHRANAYGYGGDPTARTTLRIEDSHYVDRGPGGAVLLGPVRQNETQQQLDDLKEVPMSGKRLVPVWYTNEQVRILDEVADAASRRTGAKIPRAAVMRSAIEAGIAQVAERYGVTMNQPAAPPVQ